MEDQKFPNVKIIWCTLLIFFGSFSQQRRYSSMNWFAITRCKCYAKYGWNWNYSEFCDFGLYENHVKLKSSRNVSELQTGIEPVTLWLRSNQWALLILRLNVNLLPGRTALASAGHLSTWISERFNTIIYASSLVISFVVNLQASSR